MLRRVTHLGVAVQDLESAVRLYRDALGLELVRREQLASEQIDTATFRAGDVEIELMQPLNKETDVARFLERRGQGIHHVAYEVDDIDRSVEALRTAGIEVIGDGTRPGLHETRVAFIHPRSALGVLVELVEGR